MKRNVKNFILFVLCLILTGCTTVPTITSSLTASKGTDALDKTITDPEPKPPHIETITLTATGDILMHNTQIWGGQQNDGSYNFDSFFKQVEHLIQAGDYASTNFEAPMAGPDSGYTGYPLFNSPDAITEAFKNSGFDLIVTANNHILDRGYNGAMRTLDILQKASLDTTGCFSSAEAQNSPLIKTIRGVKIGYIAYTYGTNGIPLPKDAPYLVNLLSPDKILADISHLRRQVDILVLVLHWGEEYRQQPTDQQKELAHRFVEAGADVILGSHPHVIEPMEICNIKGKNKFIIYSMGNFISAQNGLERNSGIVLNLKFRKDFDSDITTLTEATYIPTFSHPYQSNGNLQYRVVPIAETIQKIKNNSDPYLTAQDLPVLETILEQTNKQLGNGFYTLNQES
ncbi:CapA family protein [Desulfosporosinus sp. OT]|uniref:CapA family protein n=1 Tax=Desulfosporosinus sp. OT TaxID=913865 RepID=UPI000223A339|nr:CapA family protein [Desulfosporosinus sp. OT]EGW37225.1 bacterial capsule synthesis PGA_cap family protein [Desulfosporosinus sp. OT]